MTLAAMTRDTAQVVAEAFARTYQLDDDGQLRDRTGRAAPARSIELNALALFTLHGL